jgi:hypothetical protein
MGRKRIYALNESYFSEIDTSNKAYLLGFIYADGSVNDRYLSFRLAERDIEILSFIKSELNYNGVIGHLKWKDRPYISLTISSKKLISDLNKYGIIRNKTYMSKELPIIPREFMHEMLRGFFDGDGSIYKSNKGEYEYTVNFSGNLYVLNQLKLIFKLQGISSCEARKRYLNNDISCMMDIRGNNNVEKVYHYLYSNAGFYLSRKNLEFKNFLLNRSRKIFLDKAKIKELYLSGMKPRGISEKENVLYNSVRSVIQRLKKNHEIN